MKTAGRENPNRTATLRRNRAHGVAGQNRSCSVEWAAKQEKFQPKNMCFCLPSTFIERFSKQVIALWLGRKLLKTKDAVRLALDGLGTVGRALG
jgi:hypothetical protein